MRKACARWLAKLLWECLVRFGVEVERRECEDCGSTLSEWFVDTLRYGVKGMRCHKCGTVSEHRRHTYRVKPWARRVVSELKARGAL